MHAAMAASPTTSPRRMFWAFGAALALHAAAVSLTAQRAFETPLPAAPEPIAIDLIDPPAEPAAAPVTPPAPEPARAESPAAVAETTAPASTVEEPDARPDEPLPPPPALSEREANAAVLLPPSGEAEPDPARGLSKLAQELFCEELAEFEGHPADCAQAVRNLARVTTADGKTVFVPRDYAVAFGQRFEAMTLDEIRTATGWRDPQAGNPLGFVILGLVELFGSEIPRGGNPFEESTTLGAKFSPPGGVSNTFGLPDMPSSGPQPPTYGLAPGQGKPGDRPLPSLDELERMRTPPEDDDGR